jgi:hypothetical protein
MRVVVIALAALGLAAVVAGGATSVPIRSGLHGVVMRDSSRPVCLDDRCEEPAAGIVLQFNRGRSLVARVRANSVGAYIVRLRPGSYVVSAPGWAVGSGLVPRVVRVPIGRLARVNFHLDTGIQ